VEEPSGVPEAWREREGREFFSSDAVTATTAEVMQKHCYNIDRVSLGTVLLCYMFV
jgi:hypothetical protein